MTKDKGYLLENQIMHNIGTVTTQIKKNIWNKLEFPVAESPVFFE